MEAITVQVRVFPVCVIGELNRVLSSQSVCQPKLGHGEDQVFWL